MDGHLPRRDFPRLGIRASLSNGWHHAPDTQRIAFGPSLSTSCTSVGLVSLPP